MPREHTKHTNERGLDYFGARYYRAEIGRFTTIDPVYTWSENLADPQRWNRYAYARNNPLRWTDPDGRCIKSGDATKDTPAGDVCQATAGLKTDAAGLGFVKNHEGSHLTVYPDTAGNATVGYGHLVVSADGLKMNDTITSGQADGFLGSDITKAESGVRKAVGTLELSQNEFNALTDLAFNVGSGVFQADKSPGLNAAIAAGDYKAMAENLRYTKDSAGNSQPGLATRSDHRRQLFLGTYVGSK